MGTKHFGYDSVVSVSALSRRHITPNAATAEVIRPALRTEVLLPVTPHRFGRLARTLPDSMAGLFAAEQMPTHACAGVEGLADPGQFGRESLGPGVSGI
jgi:hypothetical protein